MFVQRQATLLPYQSKRDKNIQINSLHLHETGYSNTILFQLPANFIKLNRLQILPVADPLPTRN